jgi:hypothetical protein
MQAVAEDDQDDSRDMMMEEDNSQEHSGQGLNSMAYHTATEIGQ